MNLIYLPLKELEQWQPLLGNPDKHWKDEFSAKLCAQSWHEANGFPASIDAAFKASGAPFDSLKPLLILPEHQVALPPQGARPTQADVWVLASHRFGLASIAVEGKKDESFGPTMDEWLPGASDGKQERRRFLTELLRLSSPVDGQLRYQFLHRAASAILEAKRFRANVALLLIQSFSDTNAGFSDFEKFVGLFGCAASLNTPILLRQLEGISFYASWIRN